MLIEIRKAGFINKGAELMLYSTLYKMRSVYPEARFAMTPNPVSAPYHKRAELGLYQNASLQRFRIQWGPLAGLIPQRVRDMFGIVLNKDIDVVLDAAGFSYSDQWGFGAVAELARSSKRWKKYGAKAILLPQAFGPFATPKIQDALKRAADNIDLLFAREKASYQHLVGILGARPNIRIAPDFTNIIIEGIAPDSFDRNNCRICIIPNYRMIDKTSKQESEAYLPFLNTCTQYLLDKDQKPFILIHEGDKDLMLAEKIVEAVKVPVPIIRESHPLKIKGIIGACEGVISSRFHGLVSALSQGVPSLAAGWSHKYELLLEDYGFNEGLLGVLMDQEEIRAKIDLIIEPEGNRNLKDRLLSKSAIMKQATEKMWSEVVGCINS